MLFLWYDYRKSYLPERITTQDPTIWNKAIEGLKQTLQKLRQSYKYVWKEKEENGIKYLQKHETL